MPSKDTTTITTPPEFEADVRTVLDASGVDFPTYTRHGATEVKLSPVVHFAMRYTAAGLKAAAGKPKAPAPGGKPDAVRLSEAMGHTGLSQNATDRAAGVAKGTTRNVLSGSVALAVAGGGALLEWVERVERA